jgi:hypothetical protein
MFSRSESRELLIPPHLKSSNNLRCGLDLKGLFSNYKLFPENNDVFDQELKSIRNYISKRICNKIVFIAKFSNNHYYALDKEYNIMIKYCKHQLKDKCFSRAKFVFYFEPVMSSDSGEVEDLKSFNKNLIELSENLDTFGKKSKSHRETNL